MYFLEALIFNGEDDVNLIRARGDQFQGNILYVAW